MNVYDKIWQIYVYTVVDGGYKQTNIIAVARPCNQSDWHPQDLLGILSVFFGKSHEIQVEVYVLLKFLAIHSHA